MLQSKNCKSRARAAQSSRPSSHDVVWLASGRLCFAPTLCSKEKLKFPSSIPTDDSARTVYTLHYIHQSICRIFHTATQLIMGIGDGQIHYRDGIALAQLVLFAVPFFVGYYFRWTRRICWFSICGFSLIRCVGAGCMLGTVNRNTVGLWTGVFICESLGVLLLISALFEMLARIDKTERVVHGRIFWILQLLTWIDIGISIGGFVTVTRKEHNKLLPTVWSRAGIAMLLLIYLYTLGVWVYFCMQRQRYEWEQYMLAKCVGISLSFLFVRVLFSVIFVITADRMWHAVVGNPTAYLLMTMLPELAFMAACCFVILKTPPGTLKQRNGKYELRDGEQTWPGMRR
ncbi:unnamed protein product [Periconia digitata]|uniref:DUF7702 domain-containing protein n=1 Tax=Periconia digitata TaxID=1303443 RepID=A0A9W4URD4_9PLEO|nr:unnamed protein product [Periconia digitata]